MTSTLLPMPIPAGTQDSDPAIDGERLEQTVRLSSGSQPTPRPLPAKTGSHGGFPQVPGYEVLGVIGVGGMGIVYKARHRELNRIVALKMLGREWESDLDSREPRRSPNSSTRTSSNSSTSASATGGRGWPNRT